MLGFSALEKGHVFRRRDTSQCYTVQEKKGVGINQIYIYKPVEERRCKICESGVVENEFHSIFSCTLDNNIRATFLQNIGNIVLNKMEFNEVSQIKTFMSKNFVCCFAKLNCDMFQKRHDSLFI